MDASRQRARRERRRGAADRARANRCALVVKRYRTSRSGGDRRCKRHRSARGGRCSRGRYGQSRR